MNGRMAPERWLVLEVDPPGEEAMAGLVVDALLELSGRGVEETPGGRIVAYLADDGADPDAVVAEARSRIEAVTGRPAPRIAHRWQAHQAWEENWKRGFAARRITPRLVVAPSWETPDAGPGDLVVTLDPGMAFGTAEHATTRGALRLLDPRIAPGDRVADVGCGSGILGIAAALMGAASVLAIEGDPWACAATDENAERNGVADRIAVRRGWMGARFLPEEGPFDGILANIESGVLSGLLPGLREGLKPGGWLILSGILGHEADAMIEAAGDAGLALEAEDSEGEWWSGAFRPAPAVEARPDPAAG